MNPHPTHSGLTSLSPRGNRICVHGSEPGNEFLVAFQIHMHSSLVPCLLRDTLIRVTNYEEFQFQWLFYLGVYGSRKNVPLCHTCPKFEIQKYRQIEGTSEWAHTCTLLQSDLSLPTSLTLSPFFPKLRTHIIRIFFQSSFFKIGIVPTKQ